MTLPDYHMHTTRCNHAEGTMAEYVERAIALGFGEIGFSDHMPVMPEPDLCMGFDELPGYVGEVMALRERYGDRITIRLGGEMDMELDRLDDIRGIIEEYPFDYIIGSIHYLNGWPFDQVQYADGFRDHDVYDVFARYFDAIIRAVETGLCDIVGHADVIKCLGYRPERDLQPLYENVAAALKEHDLAYEINTSGFDKPAAEQYPAEEFVAVLHEYDIPVTVGSDSHAPGHVGRYFDRAHAILSRTGYETVSFFELRRRIQKPVLPVHGE